MDLKRKLETGDFAILAEIEPPKGTDITAMVNNAAKVKEEVTAFVVPEMSNARATKQLAPSRKMFSSRTITTMKTAVTTAPVMISIWAMTRGTMNTASPVNMPSVASPNP